MSGIFADQWTLLILGALACTFNIYAIEAERGRYAMGSSTRKYAVFIEAANWLVLLGVIIYLSYLYTWWFLLSFFVFPAVGAIMARILGKFTQLVYIFGMPVAAILVIMHLTG